MRFLLQLFLLAVLAGWIIFGRYYYVCKIKNLCGETTEITVDTRPRTLTLKDGSQIILDNYEQFSFGDQSVDPNLSDDNTEFLDQIKAFMDKNPDKALKITGLFRESEVGIKSGIYDNLGIGRAKKIESLLKARGIDESRFSIDFKKISGNNLLEPVTFVLNSDNPSEYGTGGERLAEMKFDFNNMTFTESNFDFNSAVFKPGTAFISYADSVKTYLDIYKEQTLTIVGHTDDIGSDPYNNDLGKRRAQSVRTYFRNLGLEAKINIDSKGEKQPVAPNDSDENRQKNRRVNVLIQ